MVFRIRDKSLFWTKSGWKNNWDPKVLNNPKPSHPTQTAFLFTKKNHHSFLRMVQAYRNYSRICKQYLYGDKKMEQALQMELRSMFLIPFNTQTPVQLIEYGGQRRLADQLDRHLQLMTYNYHPFQLYSYKLQNKAIRKQNEEAEQEQNGQVSRTRALEDAFAQQLEIESNKLPQGQKLSLEKLSEVYNRVVNNLRQHTGQNSPTRGSDGEYVDYLQKRRPFVEADNLRHSH